MNSGNEPAILRGATRLRGLTNFANGRPKVAFRGAPPILAEFLMAKAGSISRFLRSKVRAGKAQQRLSSMLIAALPIIDNHASDEVALPTEL